jgi:hypothetical protein
MDAIAHTDAVELAWSSFCSAFRPDTGTIDEQDEQDEQRFDAITDAADVVLGGTSATTLAGIAGKLRRVFASYNTDRWAERLAIGEDTPEHRRQLDMSDLYSRMLWGAIEDLELIAERENRA